MKLIDITDNCEAIYILHISMVHHSHSLCQWSLCDNDNTNRDDRKKEGNGRRMSSRRRRSRRDILMDFEKVQLLIGGADKKKIGKGRKWEIKLEWKRKKSKIQNPSQCGSLEPDSLLEIVFHEQSYSRVQLRQNFARSHFREVTTDRCQMRRLVIVQLLLLPLP